MRDWFGVGTRMFIGSLRQRVRVARRRLEETSTLIHVSILLFVPALIALMTYLSNRSSYVSFFILPPLAAGTYALFANPESKYASPVRFVAGLSVGAICSWVAMEVAIRFVYPGLPPNAIEVDAAMTAFAVFLAGLVTWVLDIEEAAAFSMALLGLLVDPTRRLSFVVSVFVSSGIVAVGFAVWRDLFYEQRARYLYESIEGDDHVLVPIRGEFAEATAMLGARLAADHDAGKVVLLDIVEESPETARDGGRPPGVVADGGDAVKGQPDADTEGDDGMDPTTAAAVSELESLASRIETNLGVPCQIVVAAAGPSRAETVRQVASEASCDLIVAPYETDDSEVTPFIKRLLEANRDVLIHRSCDGRQRWRRIMVPVRQAGDTAHNMIDFALRLAGPIGHVSIAHCIDSEKQRRNATQMLANLAETIDGTVETRVPNASIHDFLLRSAPENDLIVIGSSGDRSVASRLVSPPTFKQIDDLETDVAIVDRH
ncbi:HPP family protein [Natronomonas gomsonensis]|jgi:nucleotide-binding universal stress UspA family protein|uniref:HPP family protein n=1 Tax=Natronomonas gomsonensis TaxID=1046043 RepID=UPI0020CA5100|nr:HPP family protein [Natronomonas gomsonensis]